MRKITLFTTTVAVFVLIGIDTWLCIRTMPRSALAGSTFPGSTFNRLSVTTVAKGSPISHRHYNEYLLMTD
jgi:hypothetical protein